MADGSIVFETRIDNAQVEKDLRATEKKIKSAEDSIGKIERDKLPYVEQAEELSVKLDVAKQKLFELQNQMKAAQVAMAPGSSPEAYLEAYSGYDQIKESLTAQEKEVNDLQKQWDKVNDRVDEYDRKIQQSRAEIEKNTAEVGRLRSKLGKGGSSVVGVFDKADKSASRFHRRIISIGMSAFVFNILSAGLRSAVQYMGKMLKTNSQYTQELARVKAALLAAFQPIYEFVLPGLIMVLQILTSILTVLGKFLAWITGKDYAQMVKNAKGLYGQAHAIDAVGESAKKTSKYLADFDELNRIGESEGIGVGGAGTGTGVKPDFGSVDTEVKNGLNDIFELVTSIGAGLLAWKIASKFTDDLKEIAGIALAVGGAAMYAFNWWDAFSSGIDWENLLGMLAGMGATVGGLFLAFGKTGGAIGLLITSLGLLGVACYEWVTTGELTNEAFAALEIGILGVGGAISLMTGSWIPLLIAGIVGLVVAIATKSDEIRAKLHQLDTWLQGQFTRDWTQTFGPVLGGILNSFRDKLKYVWDNVRTHLEGWISFIHGTFTGNWREAWNGIKNIFSSAMNFLPGVARSVMNSIIGAVQSAISWVRNLISSIRSASFARSRVHGGFGGFFANGGVLRSGWGVVGEAGPEILQMVNGRAIITPMNIPRLAQGAVLPANKPFMAMVGDQRHGTNIEAPLETIQEAVAQVMDDQLAAMLAGFEAVVQAIQEKDMSVVIGDKDIGEANARYSRRVAIRRG